MHLLVPFASSQSEACRQVLGDVPLPNLERLLARLTHVERDDAEATTLSPPHERALAAARGWHGDDGCLPFAADAAAADGIAADDTAWGSLTPLHWQLGRDHVIARDPVDAGLRDDESRALYATFAPLAASEGFACAWGSAERWYLGRDDLDRFPTASLDRVVGRDVAPWVAAAGARVDGARRPLAGLLRRLQSEAQLAFHSHPVNEAREERGELTVNSFWLSGCGRRQASDDMVEPVVLGELRRPMLGNDWVAWADAWRNLDAGPLATALAQRPDALTLTLCGERGAARYSADHVSWLGRLRRFGSRPSASEVLATL